MKRVFIVVFIIIFLCFGAIIIAPSFIDLNSYKDKAVYEVKTRTGLGLSLGGDIEFSLLPSPRFVVNDVSIASPDGSKSDNLVAFDRLDVNIDLMPLFKGQISVNSITLVKPVIALEMFKNGSINMLTKKVQSLINGNGQNKAMPEISLNQVRIKDGAFTYYDHKSKQNISVQNINADLSAASLNGSFKAQGSMFYDGHAINFDVSSDAYDANNKVLPAKATIMISPVGLVINYAGAINFAGEPSIQGQTSISMKNIEPLNAPLEIKGMLSASAKSLNYKNFDMSIGSDKFNGTLSASFSPFKYSLSLKSVSDIDLHKLLQKELPFKAASIDFNAAGSENILDIKNTTIKLDDIIFKVSSRIKSNGSPAKMDINANIQAMGGKLIFSGNLENSTMDNMSLQIKHPNMAQAIKAMSGANINDKNLTKPLDLYAKLAISGQKYFLNNIKADLSGMPVKGDLEIDLERNTPKIKGKLSFGKINMASVMTQQKSKSRWSKSHIDTSALHMLDANISISAQKIEYGAWPLIKPSLKLDLNNGVLNISDMKAGLFGGNIALNSTIQSAPSPRQPIHFNSDVSVKNANLGHLSKALIGAQLVKISGIGSLDMSLKSSGASPAALIHDLSGKGAVAGENIVLDGVDINKFARALSGESKASDTISGIWGGASKGGKSVFDTLDGAFVINEGVVQINKMDLDGLASKIETRGNINLPNWTLATKHKITVKGSDVAPSDVPPFEISFSGSLDNPAQTFGQGLLDDYLNRKIQRKLNKVLSDKLGIPSNDNKPQKYNEEQSQQPQTPSEQKQPTIENEVEEVLKGILGGLLQ